MSRRDLIPLRVHTCTRCGETKPDDPEHYIFYRTGPRAGRRAMTWCRPCDIKDKVRHGDVSGYVPRSRVQFVFVELTNRLGKTEAARAIGMTPDAYRNILQQKTRRVQKRHVRRAIVRLRELREQGIALHREDIKFGLEYRRRLGHPIRLAKNSTDFYVREGDRGTELKRASRKRLRAA